MCKNFLKQCILLFFLMGSFFLAAQDGSLYGSFEHDSIPGLRLSVEDNCMKLTQFFVDEDYDDENLRGVDCLIGGDCLLEGTISVMNDTIYLHGKPYFKIISKDMILSLQDMKGKVRTGDVFYCTRYYDSNKNTYLLGSIDGWKNGQKNGRWIYLDHAKLSGIIFKDGVIVDTFAITVEDYTGY